MRKPSLFKPDGGTSNSKPNQSYSEQDFDLSSLEGSWLSGKISSIVGTALSRVVFPFMQRFKPVISLRGFTLVARHEDVKTVLASQGAFGVPFGEDMLTMTGGPVFALGDDGDEHDLQIKIARQAWDQSAILNISRDTLDKVVPALLEDSGGDIDVATDVLMRGMAEACISSFGLRVRDAESFAAYATACSVQLFANPLGSAGPRQQAMIGAKRIRGLLDASVDEYLRDPASFEGYGFLQTLMKVQEDEEEEVRKNRTRAILFGFITGFVPTVSLAAGKIVLHLRKHPDLFTQAVALSHQAKQSGDTAELTQFLFEVARHNPALFPGQARRRICGTHDQQLPSHLQKIPDGNLVFALTAAALHDARVMKHPHRFRPSEGYQDKSGNDVDNLLFGFGIHECFGTQLAKELIPVVLGHVLTQPEIAFSAKKPRFFSAYPGELRMTFKAETGQREQTMLNALLPLKPTADADRLIPLLQSMNAATSPVARLFQEADIVHFASLTAVNLGEGDNLTGTPTHLLIELNMDGGEEQALNRLSVLEGRQFTELLTYVVWEGTSFIEAVRSSVLRPNTRPWGTIGVNFPGTSDMSVRQIDAEKELYAVTQEILQDVREERMQSGYSQGGHEAASQVFERVRKQLSRDPRFEALFYRPSDRFPAFSRYSEKTYSEFLNSYLFPKKRQILFGVFVLATIVVPLVVASYVGWIAADLTFVSLWTVPLFLFLTVAGALIWTLLRKESSETPDKSIAPHDYVAKIQAQENRPGYVQNHITSVSTLKPGLFRKLTTALAFDLILSMAINWFRPGFVTDFATIHYARWVRPKGIEKMIFQSNYDGSWESYLEDFITKVHAGQTMAWNNCVGFPKTSWFSNEGAEDGDAFKRWVRLQQVPMQFWFSRFPDLTTGMIRTNALVRDGLARAQSFDEHKAWLSLFESVPSPEHAIETAQVQTLLFRGMGQHGQMKARLLHFGEADKAKAWLSKMVSEATIADAPVTPKQGRLSFGDAYPNGTPAFLALSASGLQYLGLPDGPFDGVPTLPHAFVDGMARRHSILGDVDSNNDPLALRWSDTDASKRSPSAAHALLLIYARNDHQMAKAERDICEDLDAAGISTIHEVFSDRARANGLKEMAFGFNDGISQPIMSGTQAQAKANNATDDIVGPGEFILGYPDSRGHLSPQVTVSAATPAAMSLPASDNVVQGTVARFGKGANGLMDFGRNGSFLVVREFVHNEKAFADFVKGGSEPKNAEGVERRDLPPLPTEAYEGLATTEQGRKRHKEEWIGAKMFGRWKDGSSLTRHPSVSATTRRRLRFHKQVVEALEALIQRQAATRPDIHGRFHTHFGNNAQMPDVDAQSAACHVDKAVWTDADWRCFVGVVDQIEKDFDLTLDVDRSLLKPIKPDNDFRHGTDDPQGLSCPFGSHIRRSNPRDSFRPGSEVTLAINNRHRLLRRGRTFTKDVEGEVKDVQIEQGWITQSETGAPQEDGTFFMCFNANLERQFEFVQQTWLDSRVFHGGREGPDPIVSSKRPGDRFVNPGAASGTFLELHENGPDDGAWNFVKVVAGGYFFVPSRQALEYLSKI